MSDQPDADLETVKSDCVVSFHYELLDDAGETLESSRDADPLVILQGHSNVVRGVEQALEGHRVGDRFEIDVPPEDGYGERRDTLMQRVSKKYLVGAPKRLQPGMQVHLQSDQGPRPATIVKVGSSVVDVDLNHPMAGRTLHFKIEITSLRAAEAEEIAHGHVHGPEDHEH